MKRVAVIGAGCSGLAAIKCCLDEGIEPVCFERENDIGGLWNYSDTPKVGKGSVYKSCVINTSKEMMAFSDFPPPDDFPSFMPHKYVLKYFRLYAENFGLLDHIKFQTSVDRVVPADDYEETGRWRVTFTSGTDGPMTDIFDGVLICTGHHTYPHLPKFRGLENFKGTNMHSHSYRDNKDFHGKNVLVVGIGNSGVDIAVDISHAASQVYLSTRRGAWVVSRKGFWGYPADAIANSRFLFTLPKNVLQWSVEKMCNFNFDHEAYGVKPSQRCFQTHPTINDELPFRIMVGSIQVRPDVHEFTDYAVSFVDGTTEQIDAVVFATGYDYKIAFLDNSVTTIENNQTCLYKYMFPPHLQHPTLGIVGLVQAIGAIMPISEIQCRWFTRLVTDQCTLPSYSEMIADIQNKRDWMNETYVTSQRHTLQTFWIEYMDQIAEKIGVRPNFTKLFFEDPYLATRCFFGPCLPTQFRLEGPGKWNGAKRCIQGAISRCMKPPHKGLQPINFIKSKTRRLSIEIQVPNFIKPYFVLFVLCFLFMCLLFV